MIESPSFYRLTGSDSDYLYFATPSTTRLGVEHDQAVCKRTGFISCSCEDGRFRKKEGDILDPTIPACKHIAGLHREWRRLAIGTEAGHGA